MGVNVESLVERNRELAAKHVPIPTFQEIVEAGGTLPKLLIVTCADPRCDPRDFAGVKSLEMAIVVRNVCGHTQSAIESILALDALVTFEEIMIVHHTDCGSLQFKNEDVKQGLKARAPGKAAEIDNLDFGAILDVPKSVMVDLAYLKASPYMRKELVDHIYGFVFDIKTGLLTAINA